MRIRNAALFAALAVPAVSGAQTDYFNTDRGRPLRIQDAVAIERYAFELQAAPVSWSRHDGRSVWSVEPGLAYGILPRTQFEVGIPVVYAPGLVSGATVGLGALHASVLHVLNTETLGIPALALSAEYSAPVGDFGPPGGYPALGVLATRTTLSGRLHVNADFTIGDDIPADHHVLEPQRAVAVDELSRWMVGAAIDHAFPLRSALIGAEFLVRQPIVEGSSVEWKAGAGVRWQLDPQWALDAGLGRSFGPAGEWSMTFGAARSFGLIQFMPTGR